MIPIRLSDSGINFSPNYLFKSNNNTLIVRENLNVFFLPTEMFPILFMLHICKTTCVKSFQRFFKAVQFSHGVLCLWCETFAERVIFASRNMPEFDRVITTINPLDAVSGPSRSMLHISTDIIAE